MSKQTSKFRVRELKVRRENGDLDTLYLCGDCEESTSDFLKVLKRRLYDTRCERCGKTEGDVALDLRVKRGF